jgi:hypothetical protein
MNSRVEKNLFDDFKTCIFMMLTLLIYYESFAIYLA